MTSRTSPETLAKGSAALAVLGRLPRVALPASRRDGLRERVRSGGRAGGGPAARRGHQRLDVAAYPCRLLAVAGENEQQLILQSLPEIASAYPLGTARIAPGVGHGWSGEAPELFAGMIRAHVAGAELPAQLHPVAAA